MPAESTSAASHMTDLDYRGRSWYVDRAVAALVFVGGISAVVFILGIFVFIAGGGLGFLFGGFEPGEFFSSPAWRPTSNNPTYGALALIAGTASVTGLAMLVSVPFSLGAAIFIAEFATGIGPAKSIISAEPKLVARAHTVGLSVTPYTFRSSSTEPFQNVEAEMWHFLFNLGVDALFTDNPDLFPRQ